MSGAVTGSHAGGAVVVLGDAAIDVTVARGAPISAGGDVPAGIHLNPGGQGANVAVRIARRGLDVRLLAGLADDVAGRLLAELLRAEGITLVPVEVERSGTVVVLLDRRGDRTMLSDRPAWETAKLERALAGLAPAWLHVSGYLLRGPDAASVARGIRNVTATGRVSLAGGSVRPGAEARRMRAAIDILRPDLLVLGRGEAAALTAGDGGAADLAGLAGRLAPLAAVAVVTAGAAGAACAAGASLLTTAADRDTTRVVDATGAGDAFVATLVACLQGGAWPPSAGRLSAALAEAARAGAAVARVHGAQGRVAREPR